MEASAVTAASAVAAATTISDGVPMWIFYVALAIIGMLLVSMLYFANRDKDNPFEIWQFVSSKGVEGKYYPDITKLGQWHGIVATTFVIILMSAKIEHITPTEFMWVLVICLTYLAGVQMFQAIVKAWVNRKEPQQSAPAPAPSQVQQQ